MVPATDARSAWGPRFAALVWLTMMAAVLWPAVRGTDDFPLSNYPMFSSQKGETASIRHVVGFSTVGNHRPMPPSLLGTDEIMQASQTATLAYRGGPEAAAALCRSVAKRASADADFADIEWLEVRRDVFDSVAYWQGDRSSRSKNVAARCKVPGRSGASR